MKFFLTGVLCIFVVSCSVNHPIVISKNNKFINEKYVIVPLAYKANVMNAPGVYTEDKVIAKLKRDDLVTVFGYEKGYAKVKVNGQTGYISEQYFKETVYYDFWKQQYWINANQRRSY